MFSREVALAPEVQICAGVLPSRGSNHAAFVEMLFLWGEVLEEDQNFRRVTLPSGFSCVAIDACRFEIQDLEGHVRAVIKVPQNGGVPSIAPTKRYSVGAEMVGIQHRGIAYDHGNAVYRTKPLATQQDAVSLATKWLNENKPRWDSYVSAVNFE